MAFRWPSVSLCPRFFSVLIESQGPGSGPEKKGKFRTSADRPFVIWTKVNDHSLPSWTMIAPPLINFGPSLLFPSFPPFRRSSILFYFNFRCLPQKNLKMEPEYGRKERPIRRLREREKTEEADGLTINRVVCPSNPLTALSTESNDQSVTADSNCSVQSAATAIGAIRADSSFFQSMTSSASYLLPAASDPHWM